MSVSSHGKSGPRRRRRVRVPHCARTGASTAILRDTSVFSEGWLLAACDGTSSSPRA
jgi:hypothetical protein